jgi:predicted alpha/beta hydrolase family esterase
VPWETSATERRWLDEFPVVAVPGSPGTRWDRRQSAWLRQLPRFARVDAPYPRRQHLDLWARAVVETATTFEDPVVVIASGVGCQASIRASSLQSRLIAGALLVAPADPACSGMGAGLAAGAPDFPTVLAVSSSDPWLHPARAQELASAWGSELVVLRQADEMYPPFGYIGWRTGLDLLERLCRRVVDCSVKRGIASPPIGSTWF